MQVGWRGYPRAGGDDAFPAEGRVLEIWQKRELKAGDVEVAEHLCSVRIGESRNEFRGQR